MGTLITAEEEEAMFGKLMKYYEKLYEGVHFSREEKELSRKEIGEVLYTYPGEESELNFKEKTEAVTKALKYKYAAPLILLRKGSQLIVLDGHRRLWVAWKNGLSWKALIMVPDREVKFGIEEMAMGKVKDLW